MGCHHRAVSRPLFLAMVSLLVTLIGCGAGYHVSTVNGVKTVSRTDEQGNRTLVYEVDKDGNTTVYDEQDPMYQKHRARQHMTEQTRQAAANRSERITQAPKRNTNDPIYVALSPPTLDKKLKQAEHTEGAISQQMRKEFESDRVIRLVSAQENKRNELAQIRKALAGTKPFRKPMADVDVAPRAYMKEVYGINRTTGKAAKMIAVVFEATITSNYLPAEYKVTESGNVLRNVEVTKRFVDQIKRVIKEKIGPTIPADRSAY